MFWLSVLKIIYILLAVYLAYRFISLYLTQTSALFLAYVFVFFPLMTVPPFGLWGILKWKNTGEKTDCIGSGSGHMLITYSIEHDRLKS